MHASPQATHSPDLAGGDGGPDQVHEGFGDFLLVDGDVMG